MSGPLRLVLATHNQGKVAELRDILADPTLDLPVVDLLSADDVGLPDVEETGDTFQANALLKARAGVAASGLPCVADDSGLEVDALDGAPGIYSARYAAREDPARLADDTTTDTANLELVLDRLSGVPTGQRTGRFVCAAAVAWPDGTEDVVRATMEGTLLDHTRGDGGFGYDPIFLPDGHAITSAEMTPEQKHAISHRGKAFRQLATRIAANPHLEFSTTPAEETR
ncbi:RdgB/HAM1 family non-canonical purine NTP pyrophosphatase [Euzebya tangerina]|uniref:RdgB/HAM1 family non-canonical purine NTP pyrophosphatase n=1 Tax=Euzebya tangerina TaxID=591198 RepID=UPI000E3186BB|nr:RdgB/HAM1 family non-canonical purine NTP pyrophosphatase [Euzebya tangerina]